MINLLDDSTVNNPYPTLNKLREEKPIYEIEPGNIWVLSRHEDVIRGLENSSLFTSGHKTKLFSPAWLETDLQRDFFMPSKDGIEYKKLRNAISPPFSKHETNKLEPMITKTILSMIDKTSNHKAFDFIFDFAFPYVSKIIGNITGLEDIQSLDDTCAWIEAMELSTSHNLTDKQKIHINSIARKQHTIFLEIVANKQKNPTDDFLSNLAQSTIDSKPITSYQLINIIELLIRSGYQTTVHMLAIAVVKLIHHPDIYSTLLSSPDLIPSYISEVFRLFSSAPMVMRHTNKDTTIYNTRLPAKTSIWFCLAAANRDPRYFKNPNEFDLERKIYGHLAFGYGAHICLGIHLAKSEIEIAIKYLLPLIKYMSCPASQDLKWLKIQALRSLAELPVSINK